jgi:deazaflavin-dependent oxidoreductase (nitroreductase family)
MWFMNKIANPLVGWTLRSRLHTLLSASLLLLTYRGRKSGREYRLPVQYAQDGQRIFILPGQPENKTWWRNFKDETPVTLTLRGKTRKGKARLLDGQADTQTALDGLAAYLRLFPALAKAHKVRTESDGSFNPVDLEAAAAAARIICVTLNEGSSR